MTQCGFLTIMCSFWFASSFHDHKFHTVFTLVNKPGHSLLSAPWLQLTLSKNCAPFPVFANPSRMTLGTQLAHCCLLFEIAFSFSFRRLSLRLADASNSMVFPTSRSLFWNVTLFKVGIFMAMRKLLTCV